MPHYYMSSQVVLLKHYIICVQPIPEDHIIYQYSEENVFKIRVISLKNIDGNEKLNSISKKNRKQ